jgi:type IV secretory pathway protease TraF
MRIDPQLALVGTAGLLALAVLLVRAPDVVLYNDSPSMPVGFYLRTHDPIRSGSIVTLRAHRVADAYARER